MTVTVNIALMVSICAILGTVITAVMFFGKLKWQSELYAVQINELKQSMNSIMFKLDGIVKTSVESDLNLKYMQIAIVEIKEKISRRQSDD